MKQKKTIIGTNKNRKEKKIKLKELKKEQIESMCEIQ